jgi:hypothetical protein
MGSIPTDSNGQIPSFNTDALNGDASNENGSYLGKSARIPLHNVPAFTPSKKLRVVTIGAGFSGMIFAHKLQYTYAKELGDLVEHTIFESRAETGGTWIANTVSKHRGQWKNPGRSPLLHSVLCDGHAILTVSHSILAYSATFPAISTLSPLRRTRNGHISTLPALRFANTSNEQSGNGSSTATCNSTRPLSAPSGLKPNRNGSSSSATRIPALAPSTPTF